MTQPKIDLSKVPARQLLDELRMRPDVVVSIWEADDGACPVAQDDKLKHLSSEQQQQLGLALLNRVGSRLIDELGEAGVEFLDREWTAERDSILAEHGIEEAVAANEDADEEGPSP